MDLKHPPPPLPITWQPKPVSSARSGIRHLPDGRLQCWIEHDLLRAVTPAMLVWWFRHMEGDMTYQGQRMERYRVWHPVDHIRLRYAKRLRDGSIGVGSVFHITEMFGARPEYLIDVLTDVARLDEGGFAHRPRKYGVRGAVRMDYEFSATADGTRYANSLTIGFQGAFGRVVNRLIQRSVFDEEHAHAWIKHNIEEVGQFEAFLPDLYASREPRERDGLLG